MTGRYENDFWAANAAAELERFRATGDCRDFPPQNGDALPRLVDIDAQIREAARAEAQYNFARWSGEMAASEVFSMAA